ncbi:MAG: hypothetical protein R2932_04160 [Caldilineaceae bacterium]
MEFCQQQLIYRLRLVLLLANVLFLLIGCSSNRTTSTPQPEAQPTATAQEIVGADVVNTFVQTLPDWQVPDNQELPPELIEANEEFIDNSYQRCETVEYDRKRNFDNLIAVGANATALKPGMLVKARCPQWCTFGDWVGSFALDHFHQSGAGKPDTFY